MLIRTAEDLYVVRKSGAYRIGRGIPTLSGATAMMGGVNFTVYSARATSCTLVLYRSGEKDPMALIPFPEEFRIGNMFTMIVFELKIEDIEYGYSVDGVFRHAKGDLFDRSKTLLDPYAMAVTGRSVWGAQPDWKDAYQYRAKIVPYNFNWEGDRPLRIRHSDMIIYETHLRGFTRHASSGVAHPGTYAGFCEKIPYLKELGVNAVELLPIFEFDEQEKNESLRVNFDGERLCNYWGYSTVSFFAPKAGYAASGRKTGQVNELKAMIKELHQNGIAVILDVVFNHTAEGNEYGPCISFKGLDNHTYYMMTPEGGYKNYSGCGNTLNCNHPIVRDMILTCLRYWTSEFHVDGFRFDLASILGRNQDGSPMANPPLLETLAFDPLLGDSILIAEAWDAGGLYQVGSFPAFGRWSEWNGQYRDDLRRYLKGDAGFAAVAARRIAGSEDLYDPATRGKAASINFITCHDGFSLYDLYAYSRKHNEKNGWNNADGADTNYSWNCGEEGESDNDAVAALRRKLIKNAVAVLLCSRGIPMLLAGDEFCNTQFGNNNPYCQDNEISWLDWTMLEKNREMFAFFKAMIAFRKSHAVLRGTAAPSRLGYAEISLHGVKAWEFDASHESRVIGMLFAGAAENATRDEFVYLVVNAHWERHRLQLPRPARGYVWTVFADTSKPYGKDVFPAVEDRPMVGIYTEIEARSVLLFSAMPI